MQGTPAGYVDPRYLHEMARAVAPLKKRLHELLAVGAGMRILDAGCGPATDTSALARAHADGRIIVGVDADRDMVALARQRCREASLHHARHLAADAALLPFKPDCFDACFCDRLLQHAVNPHTVVCELARVTRCGGRIVLVDTDHASLTLSTTHHATEIRLRQVRTQRLHNGFAARGLSAYAHAAGLTVSSVECFPCMSRTMRGFRVGTAADLVEREALEAGVIDEPQLAAYHRELEELDEQSGFYSIVPMIVVAADKPD